MFCRINNFGTAGDAWPESTCPAVLMKLLDLLICFEHLETYTCNHKKLEFV